MTFFTREVKPYSLVEPHIHGLSQALFNIRHPQQFSFNYVRDQEWGGGGASVKELKSNGGGEGFFFKKTYFQRTVKA